jgi:hypothetical protein
MPTVAVALKCADPDLEVVVGSDMQQVFHYHSVILASYSEYVDTMLASPMREQSEKKITFPDIEPDVWVSLLKFWEPGGSRKAELEPIVNHFLPIWDRYGFRSGVGLIDDILHSVLSGHNDGSSFIHDMNLMNLTIEAAVLTVQFNLERSQPEAKKFAKRMFTSGLVWGELNYSALLPFVKNDEAAPKHVVNTILGKEEMSTEEMIQVIEDDSFHSQFSLNDQLIRDQEVILHRLEVTKVMVSESGMTEINRQFDRDYQDRGPAVMQRGFSVAVFPRREAEIHTGLATLGAMDPFGKVWEIAFVPTPSDDGETPERVVLYRWEQHFTTLVPPRHGWSAVDGPPPLPMLHY